MAQSQNFTSPRGRMVWGNAFVANTTGYGNKPLVDSKGNSYVEWALGVAFRKGDPEVEAFINSLRAKAATDFPNGESKRGDFSFKITDGDTNDRDGKPYANREGYAGHWVVRFSTKLEAPRCCDINNQPLIDPNSVYPGCYIRVAGSVAGNDNSANPGIFVNISMLRKEAEGERIVNGPSFDQVFGGANGQPAQAHQPAQGGQTAPPTPPANGAATPAPPGATTPAPPAPPAQQTVRTLVATGQHSIESLRAGGWSDEAIVANGHGRWEDVPVSSGVTPDPNFLNA